MYLQSKLNKLGSVELNVEFFYQGVRFVWDDEKARTNRIKHGVSFESASTIFFDPLLKIIDATTGNELRDAVIGFDSDARLLFVVHLVSEGDQIRIISARRATRSEEKSYVD